MKKINIISLFTIITILFVSHNESNAQERSIKKLSKHKRHKIAHDLIKRGSYYNATEQLSELVKTYPEEQEFIFRLGQSYFSSRDYVNAELWLKKAVDKDTINVGLPLFYYAEALKYNAKYKEAKQAYNKFYNSKYKEEKNGVFKTIAKNEINSCEFAQKELNNIAYNEIKHLGDNVNCGYTDFSPTLKGDTLFFASMQSDSVIYHHHEESKFKHVKIYQSDNKSGSWSAPLPLDILNDKFQNTANGVFSPDKSKFYYTKCSPDRNHKMNCQIYVSDVEAGIIGKGERLTGMINAEGMTFTQPFPVNVGSGKSMSEGLYYVSDMPGGKGGLDIWFTTKDKNGDWKKATNLGGAINTIRDEITPFYDSKNGMLYFSSNYHYGFGGFDVFKAKGQQTKWEKPQNLGVPINSRVDDTYFSIYGNKESGFIVSNRPGGTHLLSETCCDDIYSHQYQPVSLVALKIINKKSKTRMEGVAINMLTQKDGALAKLTDAEVDNFKGVLFDSIQATTQNKNPSQINTSEVQYFYQLGNQKDYLLNVKVPDADSVHIFINTNTDGQLSLLKPLPDTLAKVENKSSNQVQMMFIDLFLNPGSGTKNIVATPVVKLADVSEYTIAKVFKDGKLKDKTATIDLKVILNFDLGDTEFLKGKEDALDSLTMLLNEYPELTIEIAAHTDNMGEHDFNIDLSKKRANTIETYLIGKGIAKKRMKSKGYGETQPLTPNEFPDGTDNPDARAQNRRAEIKITRSFAKTNTSDNTSKTKKK